MSDASRNNVREVLVSEWTLYVSDHPHITNDQDLVDAFQTLLRQISKHPDQRTDGARMPRKWDHVKHLATEIVYIANLSDKPRKYQDAAEKLLHVVISRAQNKFGEYIVPPKYEESNYESDITHEKLV